ncbi:unnamed protein product [Mesocestoides corti]|uniref:Uncharacterized protein n=1 Tax=Mesocestoides corti TaxID=53468 RepID=A0A3P6GXV6_MESCO|nr:unnamed protein product [Mesocestoides corti]
MIAGQLVVTFCTATYAVPIFGLNVFPSWAEGAIKNATVNATTP